MPVQNPTSGATLAVRIAAPRADGPRPALVLVPGGLASGQLYFQTSGIAAWYAQHGYVAVDFDPDGRGASGGREDQSGPIHQDGLAAVVAATAALHAVDPHRIALVSFCCGAAMAAGALARYPQLPVCLFVDWEGPADRRHIRRVTALRGRRPDRDDDWWGEREAATLLRSVRVPYQRVQSAPDHAQPNCGHALAMLRSATAAAHGGEGASPWTRLNGNPPNTLYGPGADPQWLARLPAEVAAFTYLVELVPPV